jgi:hypothetical protein
MASQDVRFLPSKTRWLSKTDDLQIAKGKKGNRPSHYQLDISQTEKTAGADF